MDRNRNARDAEFAERLREAFGSPDVERLKADVGTEVGLDPEKIYVRREVLATELAQKGVLVTVHVGRTRFTEQLAPKDLGLNPEDEAHRRFFREYVRLGTGI